ncbi:uncharacterized protein LTR77_006504 [Saxophila tyrrhenica]|uniref:Ketoreductase domain-containing protein n=1 Tax=Saxophila tyrrhenica TaxID=1690608 RepID=A0AAV9PCB5_9PEZI|nr:hypothetical protein LTR77_006504 [Saxophila tyrrhenica]
MPPFPSPTETWWQTKGQPSGDPSRPEVSAKGKNVIVTGGGTGIGAEVARYFAEAGAARIALLGRREQPLLDTKASLERKYGTNVFTASVDVANKEQVDGAFQKFPGEDKVHVVVSNAAVTGPMDPARDVDVKAFVQTVAQNVEGSLNVAQAFVIHAAVNAVAIETNSNAAHLTLPEMPGFAAYSTAKFAPGVVDTDMNRAAGGVEALGFEDHVSVPGSFYLWLASPEARFLQGKFLYANWGYRGAQGESHGA